MKRFFASVLLLLPLCVAAQLVRSPLLSTSWSQTSPFNDDCPRVGGSASAAGCGAIAVGQ
ncbi:MAG: C10 family peptidase, partial [Bacteroidaceae bacterium]|nr:C10 family peptidase [Bacteroidaceae bacterium]